MQTTTMVDRGAIPMKNVFEEIIDFWIETGTTYQEIKTQEKT